MQSKWHLSAMTFNLNIHEIVGSGFSVGLLRSVISAVCQCTWDLGCSWLLLLHTVCMLCVCMLCVCML